MSRFKRMMLAASAGLAMLAMGCGGGGDQIPLADVPLSKENPASNTPAKSKRPAGMPTSPQELIYK